MFFHKIRRVIFTLSRISYRIIIEIYQVSSALQIYSSRDVPSRSPSVKTNTSRWNESRRRWRRAKIPTTTREELSAFAGPSSIRVLDSFLLRREALLRDVSFITNQNSFKSQKFSADEIQNIKDALL